MQSLPKVSVITVIYNGEDVTCDMLESMRHVTYANVEIIVVDNASPRDCSVIAERFPEVKLIRSQKIWVLREETTWACNRLPVITF